MIMIFISYLNALHRIDAKEQICSIAKYLCCLGKSRKRALTGTYQLCKAVLGTFSLRRNKACIEKIASSILLKLFINGNGNVTLLKHICSLHGYFQDILQSSEELMCNHKKKSFKTSVLSL